MAISDENSDEDSSHDSEDASGEAGEDSMDVDQERDEEGPEIRAKLAQYVDAVALPGCPYKTSDFRERVTAETVSKKTGKPYMKNVKKPWISFKVMAAGAIPPKDAFRYVFENGADHTLAGMFDFEIAEDVQTLNEILPTIKNRSRPWCS